MLFRFSTCCAPAVLLLAAAAAPSQAQANNPLQPILDCRMIENDAARLSCFDEAAAALGGGVETGSVVAVNREEIEAVERDSFGLNLPSLPRLSFSLFGSRDSVNDLAPRSEAASESASPRNEEYRVIERSDDGQIEVVVLNIENVSNFGYQKIRFTMTNGQIWETTDSVNLNIPRTRRGETLQAEIRTAAIGSYLLRINGRGRAVRVQRLR